MSKIAGILPVGIIYEGRSVVGWQQFAKHSHRAALAVSEIWLLFYSYSVLFDTTPRTAGRLNEPALGCAHRDSHPSEDLSELPPLLVTVAGQDVPL